MKRDGEPPRSLMPFWCNEKVEMFTSLTKSMASLGLVEDPDAVVRAREEAPEFRLFDRRCESSLTRQPRSSSLLRT